jgi:NitT/TauT family transport system substrate-binding protein
LAGGSPSFRVGYFPNITHAQALYGRATGLFEQKTGLSIHWTAFHAGPTAIEALFANSVDATFIGPTPTINGFIRSKGEKFVIVAGAASGGAALVVRGDAGIVGDGDFAGTTVATPQLGNTQDVAARVWFQSKGHRPRHQGGELTIIPLSSADQLMMFNKGQIHGAWTIEPWVSRLEIEGGGRIYLEEDSLWPEGRYVTTHLIVTKSFLADHEDMVRAFIAAHVEITQKINEDKREAAMILNRALRDETGKSLKAEVITRALERVEFTWDPISSSLAESAKAAHRIHFLRRPPQLNGIYMLGLLNEVLDQKALPPVTGLP